MDPNYHAASQIFQRFRRALLTDDQTPADQLLDNTNLLVARIREEFQDDLMEYEIFLLAGTLANLRQIMALKKRIETLAKKLDAQTHSDLPGSSSC